MPLASLSNLQWKGPASFSMVVDTPAPDVTIGASSYSRAVLSVASDSETDLRATILKTAYLQVASDSEVEIPGGRSSSRVALDVDLSARPSADDIADAVWNRLVARHTDPTTMGGVQSGGAFESGQFWP